jgi:NAD(P)-dependent dehydrogenase (short-subunit alcohol dehydrogenase family)
MKAARRPRSDRSGFARVPNKPPAIEPATGETATPAPGRFAGKVALVTGASPQGIGGAIAERLAREGGSLGLVSRTEPKRLLQRLRRLDVAASWRACDVTKQADVDRATDAFVREFGRIDVVINNAGVEKNQPLDRMTDTLWHELLEINLTGAMRVTRAAVPHMPAAGGAIVSIASVLALAGCQGFCAYSASKAGLVGLTQALAVELAPRGIRAVALAPGLVVTPMIYKHYERLSPEDRAQLEACHPLGLGSPHDVAAAAAFLASGEARWITGVTLTMGWTPTYPIPVEQPAQAGARATVPR